MGFMNFDCLGNVGSDITIDKCGQFFVQKVDHRLFANVDFLIEGLFFFFGICLSLLVFFEIIFQVGHISSESLHMSHSAGVPGRSQGDFQTSIALDKHCLHGSAVRFYNSSCSAEQRVVAWKHKRCNNSVAKGIFKVRAYRVDRVKCREERHFRHVLICPVQAARCVSQHKAGHHNPVLCFNDKSIPGNLHLSPNGFDNAILD